MLPHPISRPEPSATDFSPLPPFDLTRALEQYIEAGFPPDLALDLVLNELVVRAADATHASAAALALMRGDQMVCRAATGVHAPELGIPLDTRDGLSGACVRTRSPQLCTDTESDPRVDAAISRRLGIRSVLVVPVFEPGSDALSNDALHGMDTEPHHGSQSGFHSEGGVTEIRQAQLAGVLEVYSPLPDAFSQSAQTLLEDFARECARIRRAATRPRPSPPAEIIPPDGELIPPAFIATDSAPAKTRERQPYEGWTLVLGALVILAAAAVSFMIGSRIGWLRPPQPSSSSSPSVPHSPSDASPRAASAKSVAVAHNPSSLPAKPAPQPRSTNDTSPASSDELVVYEKGRVIFRMKPAPLVEERAPLRQAQGRLSPAQASNAVRARKAAPDHAAAHVTAPIVPASPSTRADSPHAVWLAPALAESRLLKRVEPQYPADALAAHRSGDVTLEVHVAEDGTVSSVRALSGDPTLAAAAAEAVRNWRYQPYRTGEQAAPFQTDVTLTFSLPN